MKIILIALLFVLAIAFAQDSCYCSVDECNSSSCSLIGNTATCGDVQCDESNKKKDDDYDDKHDNDHNDHNNHHGNDHNNNHGNDHDNNDYDNDHDNNHHDNDHNNNHGNDHNNNHGNDHNNNHGNDHDNNHGNDHNNNHGNDHNNNHHDNENNLIINGGFERGFFGWRRFTLNLNNFWAIQQGTNFYTAHNLPRPPQGRSAAMIASPTGAAKVFLYQDFNIRRFSNCGLLKFELEYQYFYDNDGTGFNTTFWSSNAQFFSVDILTTNGVPLENIFITRPLAPQTTNNRYLNKRESFFYVNSINSLRYDQLRLQFSENAKNRLRVGIDDVVLTARCLDFRFQESKQETVTVAVPAASK